MNYGKLDKRITLYTSDNTATDSTGFISVIYSTKTIWANVKQESAVKKNESGKVVNVATFKVTFRYDASIVSNIGNFVIYYETKVLIPQTVENVSEKDNYIIVMCSNGGNWS
jgi:head-tail adaptor